MEERLLTIQEFAKLCRSTPRTLRLYEQLGLIHPVERGEWNKYRMYDPSQGRAFFKIKLLQNFHVPLKEIKEILEKESSEEFLSDRIGLLRREIEEKQKEYRFLTRFKKLYFQTTDINSIVKKETMGPYTLFGKYIPEAHYHQMPQDIVGLYGLTSSLRIPHRETAIINYLEPDTYKPVDTKIEIGVVMKNKKLPKGVTLPEGYFVKSLPKTPSYVCTYKGPTEFITLVYEKLHELGINHKLPVKTAAFDVETGGNHAPRPDDFDITTKICFPIK